MADMELEDRSVKEAFPHLAGLIDESHLVRIMNLLDSERERLEFMQKSFGSLDGITSGLRKELKLEKEK